MRVTEVSRLVARVGLGLGCIATCPSWMRGQTFVEGGGGWSYVTPGAAAQGGTYSHGVNAQISVGRVFTQRIRMRIDMLGAQFNHSVQYYPPCPFPGCSRAYYTRESNTIVGLVLSSVLNVDPRGILYLTAGPGMYEAFLSSAELHIGVSAGAGVAIPLGHRLRAVTEVSWHDLFGRTTGPSWFAPITVGLRY